MTTYIPAKKGAEYIFYISLVSQSTGQFQSNPTLAAGDFKVSIDGAALANLATLPAVTPATSKAVKVTLSTSEMNGDNIIVIGSDAAGAEWDDVFINIQTAARQIDDLAFPTTSGRSIDVTAGGEVGIDWANIGSPTTVVNLSGTTVKTATDVEADTANIQTRIPAALSGDGFMKADLLSINDDLTSGNNATLKLKKLDIQNATDFAIYAESGLDSGAAVVFYGSGNAASGLVVEGNGAGMKAVGDDTGSVGFQSEGDAYGIRAQGYGTDSGGLSVEGTGAGKSISAPQDIALPSGDLDDQLQAIDNFIDTEVTAVKAKTDQLTFGVANAVNANITHVITDPVQENGADNTNWGGTP